MGGSYRKQTRNIARPAAKLSAALLLPSILLLSSIVFLSVLISGCAAIPKQQKEYNAQYFEYFDTITSITICAESQDAFEDYRDAVEEDLKHYHQLFDIYHNYSGLINVKTINDNAGITPVTVEADLFELLGECVDDYELTGGKMNVAMGSVLAIWHEYRELATKGSTWAKVPDSVRLRNADAYTDISMMKLDAQNRSVYLPVEGMSLDLGAVAKGWVGHRICEDLRELGVTSALVSIGGNVETIGLRPDGRQWRVGIQNPDTSSETQYLHIVGLQDKALVTSGVYQRYYEVDGVRYHHIINPDTLMPEYNYESVTILCDSGALADALSTAVFNMEPGEGLAFIEGLDGVEAMWIMADESEVFSSGFAEYMEE